MSRSLPYLILPALALALSPELAAQPQAWGTVRGKIVCGG